MTSPQPAYTYIAWGVDSARDPIGVVDGDTLNVGIDLGLDVAINITLRLYGINAPEMTGVEKPQGQAAKEWTIAWYQTHCPDGRFTVKTIKDDRDKYGRYLATVVAPDGAVFNDDIVAAGHAVPYFP